MVCCRAAVKISGKVNEVSLFISTRAPRNSFHDVMKANSDTVMMAGTMAGRNTRRRIWKLLQPSMIARLFKFLRHGLEGVAHDVEAEWQLDAGVQDGEAEQRIVQLHLDEHEEQWREQCLIGNDESQQQHDEDCFLEWNRKARQPIAGRNCEARQSTMVSSAVPRLLPA